MMQQIKHQLPIIALAILLLISMGCEENDQSAQLKPFLFGPDTLIVQPPSPPIDSTLFFDDFSDGNFIGWSNLLGIQTMSVTNGRLLFVPDVTGTPHLAGDSISFNGNWELACNLKTESIAFTNNPFGFGVLNGTDAYLVLVTQSGYLKISKLQLNGGWQVLQPYLNINVFDSTSRNFRISCSNNTLKIYDNTVLVCEVGIPGVNDFQQIVLYSSDGNAVSFDDLKLIQLP